jgi:cytochrome c-type biogenesis protein CcmF
MIVEAGHYALVLALALALVNAIVPIVGSLRGELRLMAVGRSGALMQCLLVTGAFAALTYAHMTSDFSLVNVVENSHSAKPLIYKISGVWGNHEGSMLLWVLVLSVFAALVALFPRSMPEDLRANVLAVQSWIAATFLLFILLTSNPFARLVAAPLEGRDLNPILQDPGLAIHPPLLYFGYVGFSITFSFAVAALISGRIDAAWARYVRPWTLLAWVFLTLGIAMGSYWAYYTLGWGGFWFWDPVENASLMPWLAGTALLHSAIVMEKRDALKIWTIFLALLAFSLSLLGTFLVRSGVLTSVHAFASDPQRGVFILAILVFFIGGSMTLFAWRANLLKQGGLFAPISREGALVFNNLLLTACCATVFIGTLYPLALEALTGEKISVGPPYFDFTFVPLFIPLFLAMPFGQALAWKRGDFFGVVQRLMLAFGAGLGAIVLFALWHGGPVISPLMAGLAIFVIVGSFIDIGRRMYQWLGHRGTSSERRLAIPRSAWGVAFAHAGLGISLLGIAATGWGTETIAAIKIGQTAQAGPYELNLDWIVPRQGPNYTELAARMTIRSGGAAIGVVEPSRRFYPTRGMSRTEAGIATLGLGQIYVSLGEGQQDGRVDIRLYWKPLVALIWIGALIMAFGGALSLSDWRLRIGVGRRARASLPENVLPAE